MSLPLVSIAAIPPAGLRFPVGDWARGGASDGVGGEVSAVDGTIECLRRGPHVLAKGELSITARLPCDRCGELLDLQVSGPFACVYSPLSAIPERTEDDDGGPEVPDAFAGEADDVGEFDGVTLDLVQVVREFAALERPPRLLCADVDPAQDDACLARWKVRAGSTPSAPPSPFAALKNLRNPS